MPAVARRNRCPQPSDPEVTTRGPLKTESRFRSSLLSLVVGICLAHSSPGCTDRFFVICSTCSAAAWARPARPRPIRLPTKSTASTFPPLLIARHGPGPGPPDRLARHRRSSPALSADRRAACDAAMGGAPIRKRVFAAMPIATPRAIPQNIAFHEVGWQAVMADPELAGRPLFRPAAREPGARASPSPAWPSTSPISHESALHRTFGRKLQNRPDPQLLPFHADFQVEIVPTPSGHRSSSND